MPYIPYCRPYMNGHSVAKKDKKAKTTMWWTEKELEDLRALSRLLGKSMAQIVRTSIKRRADKERPRLNKLAKLQAS
jgi:hypothetical protein